jgi:hypothetical protein
MENELDLVAYDLARMRPGTKTELMPSNKCRLWGDQSKDEKNQFKSIKVHTTDFREILMILPRDFNLISSDFNLT